MHAPSWSKFFNFHAVIGHFFFKLRGWRTSSRVTLPVWEILAMLWTDQEVEPSPVYIDFTIDLSCSPLIQYIINVSWQFTCEQVDQCCTPCKLCSFTHGICLLIKCQAPNSTKRKCHERKFVSPKCHCWYRCISTSSYKRLKKKQVAVSGTRDCII